MFEQELNYAADEYNQLWQKGLITDHDLRITQDRPDHEPIFYCNLRAEDVHLILVTKITTKKWAKKAVIWSFIRLFSYGESVKDLQVILRKANCYTLLSVSRKGEEIIDKL